MTISVYLVIWIWFAHWVGDFVLQTPEQAQGKSTSNLWLTRHVATYTGTIMLAAMVWSWKGDRGAAVVFAWLNCIAHWLTDYITSRINARLWAEKRVHDFFVSVGFDQLIHLTTLVLTAWWLL